MKIKIAELVQDPDAYQVARMESPEWKPHVESLARSMKDKDFGQLVPIIVRQGEGGIPVLVSGFARVNAAILNGWQDIEAVPLAEGANYTRARFTENDKRLAHDAVSVAVAASVYDTSKEAAAALGINVSSADQYRRMGKLFQKEPLYMVAVQAGRIYPSVLQLVPLKKIPSKVDDLARMCEALSAQAVIKKLTGRDIPVQDDEDEEDEGETDTSTKAPGYKELLQAVWDHLTVRGFMKKEEPELYAKVMAKIEPTQKAA